MNDYHVGVYHFPNYHVDALNQAVPGPEWTEWELVKRAEPRFPGHDLPKVPAWGYEDEAAAAAMARKIDSAADHGINHFIFDWYWYNDGPFLQRGLDEGFLGAPNNDRLKFALMWANHDWFNIHPAKRGGNHPLQYPGAVTRETFDLATDHIIETYFSHPSYRQLDGCPYFSMYELMALVSGLGGLHESRDALDAFRTRTRAAVFPDLHLNAAVWGQQILPNEEVIREPREMLDVLGFDSAASYVWVHHVQLDTFPVTPYNRVAAAAAAHWKIADSSYGLPYHPNVTMGWGAGARTVQSDAYNNEGYPFMPIMGDNTPENFRTSLQVAKEYLDTRECGPRILSINAWNEWTEGSYLEPDTHHGMAYLEAIRDVFS